MSRRFTFGVLRSGCVLLLLSAATVEFAAQAPIDLFGSRRRASGAPVAPVFEGWEANPDGTFNLYFGYQNRNWEEAVSIPVGPNNFFSPGAADRGQPTHFLVNRQKRVFTVIVPKDFGNQTLVWTLISRGSTEAVPGKLSPILEIDTKKDGDNAAPTIALGLDQTIRASQQVTLTARVTSGKASGRGDTGRRARGSRLTVSWRKYRGPGTVTFANAAPAVTDGQAVTSATFSEPGVYVLHAIADEGSMSDSSGIPGFMCCWTNAQTTIIVQ